MSTSNIPSSTAGPYATARAGPTGLAIAAIGVIIFNIAQFMNWVDRDGPDGPTGPRTGYETDSLVPFIAFLGIGLLVAMAYAMKRAFRGQHRGLTLVSMAVGLAATIFSVAFAINPTGGLERGDDLAAQSGVYAGILGAAVWMIGSTLLAKEIEGDDQDRDTADRGVRTR